MEDRIFALMILALSTIVLALGVGLGVTLFNNDELDLGKKIVMGGVSIASLIGFIGGLLATILIWRGK